MKETIHTKTRIGDKLRILNVVGARPNFMKISPFCEQLDRYQDLFEYLLVHTGQHYDKNMSINIFNQLGLRKPDINLEVGSNSHAQQTALIMQRFEKICLDYKPDWIVVVGDVNSTMACTLVACKMGIKVAHIEAGLRSFDRTMPEEINRVITDALADALFTPSLDAGQNLIKEGIEHKKIFFVGNIMIDSLKKCYAKALELCTNDNWGLKKKRYIYVTLHRPSNVDDRKNLKNILQIIQKLSISIPVIFPLHPRTRQRIVGFGLEGLIPPSNNSLYFTEPVSYLDSISLAANSRLVLTDSGGLQEETTYLGIPCVTLRPNTERPVTITQGTNKLSNVNRLFDDIKISLNNHGYEIKIPEMWDGETAKRIVSYFINEVKK